MLLIKPSVELITESDPMKKIELAGRTCYKSESKITPESAFKFYNNLVKHNHTAMLEHAHFVFEIEDDITYNECCKEKYLNCTRTLISDNASAVNTTRRLVSGNLRAINESHIISLLMCLYNLDPNLVYDCTFQENVELYKQLKKFHNTKIVSLENYKSITSKELLMHTYTTMRFICDRGVSHELVRHRKFSFAQESTRYVNYLNDDIKFIQPAEFDNWEASKQEYFKSVLSTAETAYKILVEKFNTSPQEARAVLPNAVKTEIIVSGNGNEWKHFFDLRSKGTTGKPHPDMKIVADIAYKLYQEHIMQLYVHSIIRN